MSFRRSNNTGLFSSRWRIAHRSLLGECGIPTEVADSDRRWSYILLHGDDYPGIGWDVSWITPRQATELLNVLAENFPSEIGLDLVRLLRQRAHA